MSAVDILCVSFVSIEHSLKTLGQLHTFTNIRKGMGSIPGNRFHDTFVCALVAFAVLSEHFLVLETRKSLAVISSGNMAMCRCVLVQKKAEVSCPFVPTFPSHCIPKETANTS
jgi:hypothetical protein